MSKKKAAGSSVEKTVYIVGNRLIEETLERNGIPTVWVWDPQYRTSSALAEAVLQAETRGIKLTLVVDPSIAKYLPLYYGAKKLAPQLGYIGVVDPRWRGQPAQRVQDERPPLALFRGWYHVPGETPPAEKKQEPAQDLMESFLAAAAARKEKEGLR